MKRITIVLGLMISHLGFSQVTDTGDKVGIGTTTPNAKLDVNGSIKVTAPGSMWITGKTGTGGITSSTQLTSFAYHPLIRQKTASGHFINLGGLGDYFGFFGYDKNRTANGYDHSMIMDLNTGNIGIGKTPTEKLDVNGLIKIPQANAEDNNSPAIIAQINDDFLYDNQYINNYAFGFHGYQDGSTPYTEPMNTYMSGYFGVDFFTSGLNRMRISRDGIVSIGTVNRQVGYKLAVNGNIKAKEIKVETGWADFVFKESYKLPTLKEVEQHIKEKGHLKDIPSEEEVKKNGIYLGEMDSKLLQKIEELTLYTIEQEKRIESLEDKNEKLIVLVEKLLKTKIEE